MKVAEKALLPLSSVIVALIVALTISPCLSCFYFSEDLIQFWLAWLERTSHPELIAQQFTMPWFQCSNMGLFYRPLVQLSYITDSLIWANNTAGLHLTNMACHLTSTVLCLLICRQLLLKDSGTARSDKISPAGATVIGALAALLFGLNPLQCEPVYWLCCRCDALCTMLSLACFYLMLLSRDALARPARILLMTLSVVACLLAILAKEQAVFVPFVIVLQDWIYKTSNNFDSVGQQNANLNRERATKLKSAATLVLPYAIMLAAYTLVRIKILGGIGGYHGTIGYLLNETMFERFSSPTVWSKIFYPLDQDSFSKLLWWPILYSICYCLIACGVLFCWRSGGIGAGSYKAIKFLGAAGLIVLLPAYQSFVITEDLFGGRCLYMTQAFLSMALAIILYWLRPTKLRNIVAPAYLALLAATNVINGSAWVARGNNLQCFQTAVNNWATNNPAERQLCLLNLPLDAREASSIYDLEQLRCLLKAPINSCDNSDRVVQPTYLRMAPDAINTSRVKTFSEDDDVDFVVSSVALGEPFRLLSADRLRRHFAPIDQNVEMLPSPKRKKPPQKGETMGYELSLKQVDMPQRADCIAITVAKEKNESVGETILAQPFMHRTKSPTVHLLWYTDLTVIEPYINFVAAQFIDDGKTRTYIFPLADRTSWKYAGKVFHVVFTGLPAQYKVVAVRLTDEHSLVPALKAVCKPMEMSDNVKADGFYAVNDQQSTVLCWDASAIKGARGTLLQISEPDFMYALYAGGYRESEEGKHSLKTIRSDSLTGQLSLTKKDFALVGKYQARVAACDKNGQVIGYFSDPVDLIVSDKPFNSVLAKAIFNLRAQPQHQK